MEQGGGERFAGVTEINMCKAGRAFRWRQELCWALLQGDWHSTEERKHARWAEGSANALEKRQCVCVLSKEPGCLN